MDTPRKTKLYNEIAKDYLPKQADMKICQYIEGLERRIEALEAAEVKPKQAPAGNKATAKAKNKDDTSATTAGIAAAHASTGASTTTPPDADTPDADTTTN